MNKYYIALIFQLIVTIHLNSQKNDFKWLLGYHEGVNKDSVIGHVMLDFNSPSGNVSYQLDKSKNIPFDSGNNLSAANKSGDFIFSFNGIIVEDKFGRKVLNSDSLCYYDECYADLQQSLVVPLPEIDSVYAIFTIHDYYFPMPKALRGGLVSYTPISINSLWNVETPLLRQDIIKDTFDLCKIAACKHANGRDWWIMVPKDSQNVFFTILLTPNGVTKVSKQKVDEQFRFYGTGVAVFSPDGKYYTLVASSDLTNQPKGSVDFYKFDRCTGMLSNHQRKIFVSYDRDNYDLVVSGAFSPDSRFLYVCESDSLFQFPISENGILEGPELIAVYDGFRSYLFNGITRPVKFRQLQLAPDGKIYCNPTYIQTREYGVINNPNRSGKACNFRQHSLTMPTIKYTSPNYPYYRLGPIDGSICDSLGIDNMPWCWWRYEQDSSSHLCFQFTDLSTYEVTEWYWDLGDGTQTRDTSPEHCFTKNGNYKVCLIVKNKNGSDTLCRTLHIASTGVNNVSDNTNIAEIFPNPANEYIILNLLDYIPQKMMCTLFNAQGGDVLSQRVFQRSNTIALESIPSGLYLVHLRDINGVIKTKKLAIE